jgi:uroporphyrinogen decarboxylase
VGQAGPWNLAAHVRGLETLLLDSLEDPDFVHSLMKFTTEVVRSVGDTLLQAGFLPSLGEAAASCSVISPKIYRDVIKPYHTELRSYFRSKKAALSMHICGYIDPIIQDVLETGINFISLDAPSSLKKLVDLAGGKTTIMGNVPTTLFATGEKEEMEAAIRACVDTAAEGSGYILCSGCEIPFNSTEDRVAHYFQYAHQYCREFMIRLQERRPDLFAG